MVGRLVGGDAQTHREPLDARQLREESQSFAQNIAGVVRVSARLQCLCEPTQMVRTASTRPSMRERTPRLFSEGRRHSMCLCGFGDPPEHQCPVTIPDLVDEAAEVGLARLALETARIEVDRLIAPAGALEGFSQKEFAVSRVAVVEIALQVECPCVRSRHAQEPVELPKRLGGILDEQQVQDAVCQVDACVVAGRARRCLALRGTHAPVVEATLVVVRQDGVCGRDGVEEEARFGFVAGVLVGMVDQRKPSVGSSDLADRRLGRHAEECIVVWVGVHSAFCTVRATWLGIGYAKIAAYLASKEVIYLSMPGYGGRTTVGGIADDSVFAAFTDHFASMRR